MASLDQLIEQLYAAPLDQFTARRNDRAAELKKAGDSDEARKVRQLRKPPATLWAANQLARTDPQRLANFIDAVDRVRTTHLRDPRAATEAMQAQRGDLAALVERAAEAMTNAGHRPSPESLRRVSATLLGAAADRRLAEDLRHGRLTQELAAPGFEVLTGSAPARRLRLVPSGKNLQQPPPEDRPEPERRRRDEDERRRRAQEAEQLEREASERLGAVRDLERELRDAETKLADVQHRLREARAAAKSAASAARRAGRTTR